MIRTIWKTVTCILLMNVFSAVDTQFANWRYDLINKNCSKGLAAYGICRQTGQSIIEDDFDYNIITIASHELGHSQNKNCMKTLGPNIDPTALAKFDKLNAGRVYDADFQCKHIYGKTSKLYKGLFKGNYTSICNRMYCDDPTDPQNCFATTAWDRTPCGNKKWCVYGVCTHDANAPVSNAGQLYDPDTQCRHIHRNSSGLCRGVYKGNFTPICGKLYCTDPSNPTSCPAEIAEEGTQCGNKKWCVDGACTSDAKAPAGIDNCLFGDKRGSVFSNGWSCADMMRIAPNNCPAVPIDCCASCAPPTTTTSSSTSQSPTKKTTLTTTTTPSTTITLTTTTIPTTTELPTTTSTPTTTAIPTTTKLSTTIPTPSTTKIPTTIPTSAQIPTIPTTTTISSTTLTPTTTKTPTTNTPSTASKTTKTKVATPMTNYSTLKINTNTTRNIENYSQHGTMLIAVGTGVAVLISLVFIFIVVCRKKIRRAKVEDIEAKKQSRRIKRVEGKAIRGTVNNRMVSRNTTTIQTQPMKIRY